MKSQHQTLAPLTYVVYETTNNITGQTYVGVFSYNGLTAQGTYKFNKYIGQGITHDGQAEKMKPTQFVKNVIEYGYDNFSRATLLTTTDEDAAYAAESLICNESYINQPMTLNQRTGGKYGKLSKAASHRKSVATMGGKNPRAIQVINTATGKVYQCIKDAAEALEINYNTLKKQLAKGTATTLEYHLTPNQTQHA
jgi:hypothetical protein